MSGFIKIIWAALLLLFGFLTGAYYLLGKSTHTFTSFSYYQESFIISGISFILTLVLIAVVTAVISKLLKSNNKLKIVLITCSIVTLIFGAQAYFYVDHVKLKKYAVIYWEDNIESLKQEVVAEIMKENEPYSIEQAETIADCMLDEIESEQSLFLALTNETDMFEYLKKSGKFYVLYTACTEK